MKIKSSVSKWSQQCENFNMEFYQFIFLTLVFPRWKAKIWKRLFWSEEIKWCFQEIRIRKPFNFSSDSTYALVQSPLSDIIGWEERRWNLNQHLLIARMCLLKRKFVGKKKVLIDFLKILSNFIVPDIRLQNRIKQKEHSFWAPMMCQALS